MLDAIRGARKTITYAQYSFEARRTIFITNPYFVPDGAMENALMAAVDRGVRVAVLVPGAIDHNIVRQASRGKFGKMLKAGVEIYEYRAALLHAAHFGHRDHSDRSIVITRIGGS